MRTLLFLPFLCSLKPVCSLNYQIFRQPKEDFMGLHSRSRWLIMITLFLLLLLHFMSAQAQTVSENSCTSKSGRPKRKE